jgi:hypothetical protein
MARADVVVIWGTNAASTQVNVMTHALRAPGSRGGDCPPRSASVDCPLGRHGGMR